MKTIVLTILDGWGIGAHHEGNPIWQTQTPTFDWMRQNFPMLALQASGIAVGLPWGEEGNSEVGHLTLGAGKVIFQHFPRITMAIKDGSFFTNPALTGAFVHAKQTGGKVHILGLLTSGNVHASFEHLVALLRLAKEQNAPGTLLHLFSDGRDSQPKEAGRLLQNLRKAITEIGAGVIASISGRFYALDRDQRWDRTERVWKLLTEGSPVKATPEEALDETYRHNLDDEFVEPAMVGKADAARQSVIRPGDALIFFDFREDGVLQIAESFANPEFQGFQRPFIDNLYVATMTEYRPGLTEHVAFPPQRITEPLAKVLSDAGKRQLHLAESEKAAHVTYFFDGLRSEPFSQEFWVIVPSPQSFKFEQAPELAAHEIMNRLTEAIEEGIYDFIVVNFANPDLIAHTGDFNAALKVVALMDTLMNRLSKICLAAKAPLIITADHGNIESMINPLTGTVETRHDPSPVPFHLIDQRFYRPRSEREQRAAQREINGSLADVAPTILNIFNIPKPPEMTGESLLPFCK
jgi:2,3-bisphosphoglycerate-independent phosphoglycerate mutase